MNKPDAPQAAEPRPRKVETQPRKQRYVYHWDRILVVTSVLLILLGFTTYGLYSWLSVEPSPSGYEIAALEHQVETTTTVQQNQGVGERVESPAAASTPFPEDPLGVMAPTNPAAGNRAELEIEDQARETEVSTQTSEPSPPVDTTPPDAAMAMEIPQTKPAPVTLAPTRGDRLEPMSQDAQAELQPAAPERRPLNQPQQQLTSSDADQSTTAAMTGPFQLKKVMILAPRVERFVLARAVSNKEPRGEISDISFKADGAAAVWCYSEVVDKPGSVLRYVWFHEGKRMARVRVDVRGSRWRSHSSKVINQRQTGAWRVELQDGAGRLLASADFELF